MHHAIIQSTAQSAGSRRRPGSNLEHAHLLREDLLVVADGAVEARDALVLADPDLLGHLTDKSEIMTNQNQPAFIYEK